jgi:hypothetical protein
VRSNKAFLAKTWTSPPRRRTPRIAREYAECSTNHIETGKLVKADAGIRTDVLRQEERVRYAFIAEKQTVAVLCRMLEVSRSGFYNSFARPETMGRATGLREGARGASIDGDYNSKRRLSFIGYASPIQFELNAHLAAVAK